MPHYQLYVGDGIHFQQDPGPDEANLGGHPPGSISWKVLPVDFFEAWFIFDIRKIDRHLDNFFQGRPCLFEESGATTVVFPDWTFRRDEFDNLRLKRV